MDRLGLYIGVDGGGTKTQVFLADMASERAVSCIGGASNPNSVGWDVAVKTVEQLIERCLQAVGRSSNDVSALSLCMAGIDRSEQIRTMREHMSPLFPHAALEVVNDALAALSAGTHGQSGIVLIAGTGSIAVGESASGSVARAGGFGNLMGDEGSGFAIGRDGLMAAIQSCEGRGPKTALWERAKVFFQINHHSDLILKVYEAPHPVGTVASFAREVVEAASTDTVANRMIEKALDDYVLLIKSVRNQLEHDVSSKVVLNGGLFTNTKVLAEALQSKLPEFVCSPLTISAAAGAVLRAIRLHLSDVENGQLSSERMVQVWRNLGEHFEWC